jgi:hypothetical protein
MKKIGIVIITLAVIGVSAFTVVGAKEKGGNPFDLLWEAIADLQEQIASIQLIPGSQGEKGDQGEKGEKGDKGDQGEQGTLPVGMLPVPAFDSEWILLTPEISTVIDVPHDVGGDINDYFIYATYRRPAENGTLKSHQTAADVIWWEDVTPNNIQIVTNGDVSHNFDAARIRIWKIQSE